MRTSYLRWHACIQTMKLSGSLLYLVHCVWCLLRMCPVEIQMRKPYYGTISTQIYKRGRPLSCVGNKHILRRLHSLFGVNSLQDRQEQIWSSSKVIWLSMSYRDHVLSPVCIPFYRHRGPGLTLQHNNVIHAAILRSVLQKTSVGVIEWSVRLLYLSCVSKNLAANFIKTLTRVADSRWMCSHVIWWCLLLGSSRWPNLLLSTWYDMTQWL